MKSNTCGRCLELTNSPGKVLALLNNEAGACESCSHKTVLRMVAEQFRMRKPRWWVVDSVVVVPVWIVEFLKTQRQI